jgi:VRR-NUC domain
LPAAWRKKFLTLPTKGDVVSDTDRVEPYPSQRRRQSQQHEAREQIQLKAMLEKWADPNNTFWTMLENRPRSAMAGMFQRHRGVRAGMTDLYVVYRGTPIHVELKGPIGTLSKTQRQVRLELRASGAQWWLARSANAAMVALARSGVEFRAIEQPDGTVERWQAPELADWEQPQQNLGRHPSHPELTARRREAKRRQRAAGRRDSRDRAILPRQPSS